MSASAAAILSRSTAAPAIKYKLCLKIKHFSHSLSRNPIKIGRTCSGRFGTLVDGRACPGLEGGAVEGNRTPRFCNHRLGKVLVEALAENGASTNFATTASTVREN